MYSERVKVLRAAYQSVHRLNQQVKAAETELKKCEAQLSYVNGLASGLKMLETLIVYQEEQWRYSILRSLEAIITEYLSFVYPDDGYTVTLTSRVLRGKVHIEAQVNSYFLGGALGEVDASQGRLFQQLVSFAALIGISQILGVNTVYIDEAFSGVSRQNVEKVNALLRHIQTKGINLILIAQDPAMADNIDANVLLLSRSLDNKTSIQRLGGQLNGC